MKTKWIRIVCCCLCVYITGCNEPTLPEEPVTETAYYPYVISDADHTSAIKVYNKTEHLMELEAVYRMPDGSIDLTNSMTLSPHESRELIHFDFTGSCQLTAWTEKYGLQSHIETRRNDGLGAALAQKAEKLAGLGVSWFYHLGVTDFGSGDVRSSIITANPWYPGDIYLSIAPLGGPCTSINSQTLPQYNLHIFNPLDIYGSLYPNGVEEEAFYVQGSHTPQPSGQSFTNFTGAHFVASPNGNIGLQDYRYQMYFGDDDAHVFLVDVQDTNDRQDRILLKRNGPAGVNPNPKQYTIHFYEHDGTETAGSPVTVSLDEDFNDPDSYDVFSPWDLLGHPFSGSVWVDPPVDGSGRKVRVKAGIIKEIPDQWRDITDNAPSKSQSGWVGSVAHVTTADPDWHYRLVLYYPEIDYIADPGTDPAAEETGDIWCDPGTEPPEVTGGQVVLKFYDDAGVYLGAFAFFMQPNETRHIDMDGIAEFYLGGSFTGSIEFLPFIAQQLETWHTNNHSHGSTGTWAVNQY